MTRQFAVAACFLALAAVGFVLSLSAPETQPATATAPATPASNPISADDARDALDANARIVVIDAEFVDQYGYLRQRPDVIPIDQMYRRFPEPERNLFPESPQDWRDLIPGSL